MQQSNEKQKANNRALGNNAYIRDGDFTHYGWDTVELALLMHCKSEATDREAFTESKFNWGEGG